MNNIPSTVRPASPIPLTRAPLNRARLALSALCALTAALALGCVGYGTYPKTPGYPILTGLNSPTTVQICSEALRWAVWRYPLHGDVGDPYQADPIAVNMPAGLSRNTYVSVVRRIGEEASPITPETDSLPTWHVAKLWVSGDEAKVDLLRPVTTFDNTGRQNAVHQGITVKLRGGVNRWHVTGHQVWRIGTVEVPELYYLPPRGPNDAPDGYPDAAPPPPAYDDPSYPVDPPPADPSTPGSVERFDENDPAPPARASGGE